MTNGTHRNHCDLKSQVKLCNVLVPLVTSDKEFFLLQTFLS